MEIYLGQDAVRAWLIIASIFLVIAVFGLLVDWDAVTRSGIIGSSIALAAGLLAIAASFMKVGREER
jgi:hypothetical protein